MESLIPEFVLELGNRESSKMKSEKIRARRSFRIMVVSILIFALGIMSIALGATSFFLWSRLSEPWASQLWVNFAAKGLIMLGGVSALIDIIVGIVYVISGYLILKGKNLEFGAVLSLGMGLASVFIFGIGGWWTSAGNVMYAGIGVVYLRVILQAIVPMVAGALGLAMEREEAKTVMGRRIRGFWEDFSHNKIGLVGATILFLYIGAAILTPVLSLGVNPDKTDLADDLVPPEWLTIFNPSLNNLPRSTVYTLNWSLDTSSIPEFISSSSSFNVSAVGNSTVFKFDQVTFPQNRSICIVFNSDTFNYPYEPPRGGGFNLIFSTWGDPNYYYKIGNATMSTPRALYNIEVNFTNPQQTFSVWDAEWYSNKLAYWRQGAETQMQVWPIELPPAQNRLVKAKQTYSISLAADMYWAYRMGYVDTGGSVDSNGLATSLFSKAGNYSFKMYVFIAPVTSADRLRPVSFSVKVTQFKLTIRGLLWGVMGTDYQGQDVWSRVVYGVKVSLAIGLASSVVSILLGVIVGIVAGYVGGTVDELLMRTVDILLCLPSLPLLMVLVYMYGRNVWYIIILIAVFGWLGLSRVIRSQILSLREMAFVECAAASGASRNYIMFRHLLPNVLPIIISDFVLSVPAAIMFEASLSFIGFGDPSTPTWGREFNRMWIEGGAFVNFSWWWVLPPGIAISILCMAFVFLGHAVDEIVNPRLRRRR
jgi:ABC-type dipeptide/oligopeptide/nickel transport system permease subunit